MRMTNQSSYNGKKYKVVLTKIGYDGGDYVDRWFIADEAIPVFQINDWLERKHYRSEKTGKKYAYNLCKFLNYLDLKKKNYLKATKKDVESFIDFLVFGIAPNTNYIDIGGKVSYSTLSGYISTITEFYKWLEDEQEENMQMTFNIRKDHRKANSRYLYGQIWGLDFKSIIDTRLLRLKGGKNYIKWYSEQEKKALKSNFKTLRDEAIFLITIDGGLRIDEALSVKLHDYNNTERVVKPHRSKGLMRGEGRPVVLSEETCKVIDNYIWNERNKAEQESGLFSDDLFINLKKGQNQGKPLKYVNYYYILKNCAKRAGIDPEKIRTHSGRSTKTMDLLEYQATHPSDNITDEIIRQIMGWSSSSSLNPYRNTQNVKIAKATAEKMNRKK